MSRKKKELNLIFMVPKEELDRRFTLAVREWFRNYTGDLDDILKEEKSIKEE